MKRSRASRLAEFQQLHDDGLITDDEFAEHRTAAAIQQSPAPTDSDRLRNLRQLYDNALLTDADYHTKRQAILEEM